MKIKKLLSLLLALVTVVCMTSALTVQSSAKIIMHFVGDEVTFKVLGQQGTADVVDNIKNIHIDETESTGTAEITAVTETSGKVYVTVKGTDYGFIKVIYEKYDGEAWVEQVKECDFYPVVTLGSSMTVVLKGYNYATTDADKNVKNFTSSSLTLGTPVNNAGNVEVTVTPTTAGECYFNFESYYALDTAWYDNRFYVKVVKPSAILDLEDDTNDVKDSKTLDQSYRLTLSEGTFTDVTKVKLEWNITDVNATRKDAKIWDPDQLKWVDDDNKDVIEVDPVTATFTITNLSSIEVNAKVEFEASEYETGKSFDPTVAYTGVDATTHTTTLDTVVGAKHAVEENPTAPTATVTVVLTPKKADFAKLNATTSTKYGTYTITLFVDD